MQLCMGYDDVRQRDGQREDEGAVRRVGRESAPRGEDNQPASGGAVGSDGRERGGRRYQRFEPITVRAAVRVLQLQRAGVLSAAEAQFYLGELAAMDRHAGWNAFPILARRARRRVA